MRWLATAGLLLAMLAFGIGVYHAAVYLKSDHSGVRRPNQISAPALPGTVYVVQGGALYKFQHGSFTQITSESGWMQPSASPDGNELVAVKRRANFSDLYLLSNTGRQIAQLTHNSSASRPENNHWSFYPRYSADGSTLFYVYDPKDPYNNFRVDLAIFSSPADPTTRTSVQWTEPNEYTGGDVSPVPLRGGGLIYTKFSIDEQLKVHSQVWLQIQPGTAGVALTPPDLDCLQPAVSVDQRLIAMVCRKGSTQSAELDTSAFSAASGAPGPMTTVVSGQLLASPSFSPDGKTIAYLAPSTAGGAFQLWAVGAFGSASVARQITNNLGLDATSAPVWVG